MPSLANTVDILQLLGDEVRVRLLGVLEGEALSLAELTTVLELPKSKLTAHVARLMAAGLLNEHPSELATLYSFDHVTGPLRALWQFVKSEAHDQTLRQDQQRLVALKQSRSAGAKWPDTVAGEMERHYSPGRTWETTARGLVGLLRLGDTLDIGSGDAAIGQLLVEQARSLTCLDASERVIQAAERRLKGHANVRFLVGDMHALGFTDQSFDDIMIFNALSYSKHPEKVLGEACRVLRPQGRLVVMCLHQHEHAEIAARYDHVNLGFSEGELRQLHEAAGLEILSLGVCTRERRKPYFEVLSAVSTRR